MAPPTGANMANNGKQTLKYIGGAVTKGILIGAQTVYTAEVAAGQIANQAVKTGGNVATQGLKTGGNITVSGLNASGRVVSSTLNMTASIAENATNATKDLTKNTLSFIKGTYGQIIGSIGTILEKKRRVRNSTLNYNAKLKINASIERLSKEAGKAYIKLIESNINLYLANMNNTMKVLTRRRGTFTRSFKNSKNRNAYTAIQTIIHNSKIQKEYFLNKALIIVNDMVLTANITNTLQIRKYLNNDIKLVNEYYVGQQSKIEKLVGDVNNTVGNNNTRETVNAKNNTVGNNNTRQTGTTN
jgi:hypothetical protein